MLLAPALCSAQVAGTFSMEQYTFARGEPVSLNLTLRNEGKESEEIRIADPYSFCSGYKIAVTRDGFPNPACLQGYVVSYLSGAITLVSHASHTKQILLNHAVNFPVISGAPMGIPGTYLVDAVREISYQPLDTDPPVFTRPASSEVHQTLTLRIDGALAVASSMFGPCFQ